MHSNDWKAIKSIKRAMCDRREADAIKYIEHFSGLIPTSDVRLIKNAARYGCCNVVKYLHKKGIDLRVDDLYVARIAVKCKYTDIIKYLFDSGVECWRLLSLMTAAGIIDIFGVDQTIFCYVYEEDLMSLATMACHTNQLRSIRFIVEKLFLPLDDHGFDLLVTAIAAEAYDVARYLIDNRVSPLFYDMYVFVCSNPDTFDRTVRFLLSVGCNPSVGDHHYIRWAHNKGSTRLARYLVDIGEFHSSIDPYPYISHLDKRHIEHLGGCPEIIGIINRRMVRSYKAYHDVIFVCR